MSSKKPKIFDKDASIKNLILTQGLILEHEVFSTLSEHYPEDREGFKIGLHLRGLKIGDSSQEDKKECHDVDVFAPLSREHQIFNDPYFGNSDDDYLPLHQPKVRNYFLIECKGHQSDGILLGRLHHQPYLDSFKLNTHVSFRRTIGSTNRLTVGGGAGHIESQTCWIDGIDRRAVAPIVDNCAFYRPDKDRKFVECKDKLYKGFEQSFASARSFEHLMRASLRDRERSLQCYTITPLICTNIPITVMQIDSGRVNLVEVEWAFMLNPEAIAQSCTPNSPDHRLIPIVQSSAITRFCDAVMSNEAAGLSVNITPKTPLLTFDIKEAQQSFREENIVS
jgi:hypothetical protein